MPHTVLAIHTKLVKSILWTEFNSRSVIPVNQERTEADRLVLRSESGGKFQKTLLENFQGEKNSNSSLHTLVLKPSPSRTSPQLPPAPNPSPSALYATCFIISLKLLRRQLWSKALSVFCGGTWDFYPFLFDPTFSLIFFLPWEVKHLLSRLRMVIHTSLLCGAWHRHTSTEENLEVCVCACVREWIQLSIFWWNIDQSAIMNKNETSKMSTTVGSRETEQNVLSYKTEFPVFAFVPCNT